jgi:hypothetical protein
METELLAVELGPSERSRRSELTLRRAVPLLARRDGAWLPRRQSCETARSSARRWSSLGTSNRKRLGPLAGLARGPAWLTSRSLSLGED